MTDDFSTTPAELRQHIITRAGCPVHYWLSDNPDRPLIMFLHGALMDHRMFNAQVSAFADDYRLLVWDARGHGKSQPADHDFTLEDYADDVVAILDQVGVASAILCGQSLGGYIAHTVYLRQPQRVRALAIIGSTNRTFAYSALEVWALQATLPLMRWWPRAHLISTTANSTAITPAARAYARATQEQIDLPTMLRIWRAVTFAVDTRGVPDHHVRVPLLLTHGDRDGTGTIKRDIPRWAQHDNVEYTVIPNAGHNANQDNPAYFNDVLRTFLHTL